MKDKNTSILHKLQFLSIIVILLVMSTSLCHAGKILTIYSDEGICGTDVNVWQGGSGAVFDGSWTGLSNPPDGYKCFKTAHTSWAGWGVFYGYWGANPQDLTDYYGGDMRFWIYSSTDNVRIEVETSTDSYSENITDHGWTTDDLNTWKHMTIPLDEYTNQGATFDETKAPFKLCLDDMLGVGATVYVDLVRWTTGYAVDTMYIETKHRETHVAHSSVTWTPVLPSTWNASNIYFKLDFDPGTTYWGIRMYTNNKEAGANPKYIGTGDAAGLVCSTGTESALDPLPMSWTIESATRTVSALGKGTVGDWVSGGHAYKWMQDIDDTSFDHDYVTIWNRRGVEWGTSNGDRDWKNSPNYLYFGANFDKAKAGRKYTTNRLIIELYYE